MSTKTDQQTLRRSKRIKLAEPSASQRAKVPRAGARKQGKKNAERNGALLKFVLELPLDVLLEVCSQIFIFLSLE
jgi:hypothetical protein